MWRKTLIIVAIFAGIVAGILLGLTSERVADNLRQRLILTARSAYGLDLEMERLRLRFLPLGVDVEGVRIRRPEQNEDWIRLHRASARIRPWPSSAGSIVIESLQADGLYFDARQMGAGTEDDRASPADLRVDVRDVGVWNAQLVVGLPNGDVNLREVDLQMTPRSRGGREVELRVGRGVLTLEEDVIDLEARMRADFEGTVDRPESLELTYARVDLPQLALIAEGSSRLDLAIPEVDVRVGARIELERIRELVSGLPELSGSARPAVRLSGPVTAPEIRLELESEDVRVARRDVGDVSVDAVYAGTAVIVESFEVRHPRGGRVTGSGRIGLDDGYPVSADARLHDALLEEILNSAGVEGAWVRMVLNSDVRATGTLSPFGVEVALDGGVERFEVLDASYRFTDAQRMLVLESVPLTGRAAITDSMVMVNGLSLGPPENRFDVEGMLHYDDGLDLRVRSERADLAWFGPIAGVPFTGVGPLAASVEGPYKSPVVSATTEIAELSILDYAVGDSKATLIFENPVLDLDRVTINRPTGGKLSGAGRLSFIDGEVLVEAAADIDDAEVGAAMRDLKLPPELASRVRSVGRGRLVLGGSLAEPEGVVHVESGRATFDGVAMGAMNLEVGFGTGAEKLWVEVELKRPSSVIDIRTAFLPDDTISVRGDVANIAIENLRELLGGADLSGTLSGRFNLAGPPEKVTGTATAQIQSFAALGGVFGTTKIRAKVTGGEAEVTGSLLEGDLLADGRVRLSGKWPYNLSSTFRGLDPTRIVSFGPSVKSSATGSFFSQGTVFEPSKAMADFRIDDWTITIAGESLKAMRTVNVQWIDQTLVVPEAAFSGPDVRLVVAGTVPLDAPMRLKVYGDGSLNALALVSNRVNRGRGKSTFGLEVGGTLIEPTFNGELTVENGELALRGATDQATNINARVVFNGAAANLELARFNYGGGNVRLGGQLVFSQRLGTEVSLRADFERVRIRPSPGIDATLSGDLIMTGPLDDLSMRGDVRADRARYTRNVDLTAIIPRRRSSGLQVPAIEPSEVIDLAVKLRADDGLFINNNVLDAEFRADLTVTGTTNRVGLLGTVTPLEAKARYAGNLFTLERGSIDFTEEYELFARFNLRAKTKACGMDIAVDVFGDSESYNLSPTGTDETGPVAPQDVLICLQFGSRIRDFGSDGSPVASATVTGVNDELAAAASGLDALWTVSGLDDRVREVLPIDEVRITNAWSPQAGGIRPRLVLGKDIGEAVRLQYWQSIIEQSPEEAYQALSVQYALSKNATLEGTWLSEYQANVPVTDLGLDLRLRWELR